jgi:GMP synthase-like glutamine amidotransferase
VQFEQPKQIGAILQVLGDHARNFRNAPRRYVWQYSHDGRSWLDLPGTATGQERRMYRILRLPRTVVARYLRMMILESQNGGPAIREVEFYPEPTSDIDFEDWVVSVSSLEDSELPAEPCPFTRLVRECPDWKHLRVQYLWHGDFDEEFVSAEPRPMCAFLSGSFLEWCQRSREPWRGVQQVLEERNLPMWGACGGAQILAILDEFGADAPWDCPRCRDPQKPCLPIYSHIGHTGEAPCGDYSRCIGERGKFKMRIVARDPVLEELPEVFEIMESHVGQIAYVPQGWVRIVTKGPGAHTVNQCIRVKDRFIYAAQFHIELPGTPENSRLIMSNFLEAAKDWGGYNTEGASVAEPEIRQATNGL